MEIDLEEIKDMTYRDAIIKYGPTHINGEPFNPDDEGLDELIKDDANGFALVLSAYADDMRTQVQAAGANYTKRDAIWKDDEERVKFRDKHPKLYKGLVLGAVGLTLGLSVASAGCIGNPGPEYSSLEREGRPMITGRVIEDNLFCNGTLECLTDSYLRVKYFEGSGDAIRYLEVYAEPYFNNIGKNLTQLEESLDEGDLIMFQDILASTVKEDLINTLDFNMVRQTDDVTHIDEDEFSRRTGIREECINDAREIERRYVNPNICFYYVLAFFGILGLVGLGDYFLNKR